MGDSEARSSFPDQKQRFAFCSSQWKRKSVSNSLETLTANFTGKVRKETLRGREYLVAPMSLLSPGVLNGSKGPLYYPAEEIAKNVDAWNGIPLVVYHPTDNGQPTSARDPEVLNTRGIGFVFRAKASGKLTAEGWFDIEDTRRVDNRILEDLESGKPIELSTGLFTENEPVGEGSNFNGTVYNFVARNYRPDHLAILPDQTGACSIPQGCGVLVNEKKAGETSSDTSNSTVSEEVSMAKKELVDELIANCSCWTEDDREVLNSFEDSKVEKLTKAAKKSKAAEQVAVAALEGFEDEQGKHVYNTESEKWEHTPKKNSEPTNNSTEKSKQSSNSVSTPEPAKSQTAQDWLAQAPVEIQGAVQNAMRIESREREALISKIIGNIEGEEVQNRLKKRLDTKPLDELEDLALLSPTKPAPKSDGSLASYFGKTAGVLPTTNKKKVTPLPLPTINYKELAKSNS